MRSGRERLIVSDNRYGHHASVGVYRAMVFNKPARPSVGGTVAGGTTLPWHQDGGDRESLSLSLSLSLSTLCFLRRKTEQLTENALTRHHWKSDWGLTHDPLVFVWTALDDATAANGCVRVVRGSHKLGILSARGHTLSSAHVEELCKEENIETLEIPAGHSFLCHNWTVHGSGVNQTEKSRLAFSVNYVDGRTRCLDPWPALGGTLGVPGTGFPEIFPSIYASQRE